MSILAAYTTDDDSYVAQDAGTVRLAQTFTIEAATLGDARFKVFRVGSPGTCAFTLYTTAGGLPSASLGAIGFNGNTITTDTGGEWVTLTFAPFGTISAGMYAVVLSGGDNGSNNINWRIDSTAATYVYGQRLHSTDTGGTWTPYATQDFMFEISGTPTYVFTPPADRATTKRLIATARHRFFYEDV